MLKLIQGLKETYSLFICIMKVFFKKIIFFELIFLIFSNYINIKNNFLKNILFQYIFK